ncbi:MAG: cob(I)yrinic acid a,c-diamide adenosyltransferase [Treponema sp.]|jgi:cob(I)alamin adenosyltransferase|nr:cob(I)yrinic acid a,c-diamide adenosyltransferase [Treponema sp.]
MGIFSGTGDTGETSTLDGQRLSKNDELIHLLGAVDEVNCHLGLVKTALPDDETRQLIENIQKKLMKLMSHISGCADEKYLFSENEVKGIEKEINRLAKKTTGQLQFVIPGKNALEAQIHIARTAARRAERLFFAANEKQQLCPKAGAYLNRLSDYLFVLSQEF